MVIITSVISVFFRIHISYRNYVYCIHITNAIRVVNHYTKLFLYIKNILVILLYMWRIYTYLYYTYISKQSILLVKKYTRRAVWFLRESDSLMKRHHTMHFPHLRMYSLHTDIDYIIMEKCMIILCCALKIITEW